MIKRATIDDAKVLAEMASDCELQNTDSLKFHLAMGFEEANRIICFKKNCENREQGECYGQE